MNQCHLDLTYLILAISLIKSVPNPSCLASLAPQNPKNPLQSFKLTSSSAHMSSIMVPVAELISREGGTTFGGGRRPGHPPFLGTLSNSWGREVLVLLLFCGATFFRFFLTTAPPLRPPPSSESEDSIILLFKSRFRSLPDDHILKIQELVEISGI